MLNIVIAVLLISFGSALAYMGIHVTLSPPASKTHLRWRVGFVVIAILIGSLAAVQAYRSNKAAGRLEALIQKEGKETQQVVREEGGRPLNVQVQQPPVPEPEDSLRKRTLKLAGELATFDKQRAKNFPGYTTTSDMSPQQQRAAMAPAQAYNDSTYKLYEERFAVPTVGIVQELKAKGMDVASIEQIAQYGSPIKELVTSLRAMAGRLDAQGNVRH
jgi:hypothetical protein